MTRVKAKIGNDGRIVIPAEYRKELGLKPGDHVILALEDDEIRLYTLKRAVKRAQELVRRYNPEGRRLSEELIRERREEAARE